MKKMSSKQFRTCLSQRNPRAKRTTEGNEKDNAKVNEGMMLIKDRGK